MWGHGLVLDRDPELDDGPEVPEGEGAFVDPFALVDAVVEPVVAGAAGCVAYPMATPPPRNTAERVAMPITSRARSFMWSPPFALLLSTHPGHDPL
jgi:hypothetical protein